MNNIIYDAVKDLIPYSKAIKSRQDGDFLILVNSICDYQFLNETAKDIYLQCDGNKTIDDILLYLVNSYDADIEILKSDLISIIRDLQCNDLLGVKRKYKSNRRCNI